MRNEERCGKKNKKNTKNLYICEGEVKVRFTGIRDKEAKGEERKR